jgi:hypothetical protein
MTEDYDEYIEQYSINNIFKLNDSIDNNSSIYFTIKAMDSLNESKTV